MGSPVIIMVAGSGIFLENIREISQNFPVSRKFLKTFTKISQKLSQKLQDFSKLSHFSKLALTSRNFLKTFLKLS